VSRDTLPFFLLSLLARFTAPACPSLQTDFTYLLLSTQYKLLFTALHEISPVNLRALVLHQEHRRLQPPGPAQDGSVQASFARCPPAALPFAERPSATCRLTWSRRPSAAL
jgi:hypothetical protein